MLEAVQYFFANENSYSLGKNLSNYIVVLELDDKDIKELEPLISHDLKGNLLQVTFQHDKPDIKFVKYAPLTVAIKAERVKLFELRQHFRETVKAYIEKLKQVEHSVAYGRHYVSILNNERFIQPQSFLDWIQTTWESDINQIDKYCEELIKEDVIQIEQYSRLAQRIYRHQERKFDFKINFNEADFCPLEKKHINFVAIQKDIEELNLQMAEYTNHLETAWDEILTVYNSIVDKIYSATDETIAAFRKLFEEAGLL